MLMNTLPIEELRQSLHYDPSTGALSWVESKRGRRRKQVGHITTDGYHGVWVNGVRLKAHRVAFAHYYGRWPDGEIDHINGIKTDNRIENIREADRAENEHNKRVLPYNRTGVKGVSFYRGRYDARAKCRGKEHRFGSFATLQEAAEAVRLGRERLHGEFCSHG